jgi:hypothetical protein
MKTKPKRDTKHSKDSATSSASRQSGNPGSLGVGKSDLQGGAIERKEESRRARSDEVRSDVSRTPGNRSGARNR